MVQYAHAFDLQITAEFVMNRYRDVQLIPFKAYYPGYASTPLIGLHEIVARCLGGVPLGLLLRLSHGGSCHRDCYLSTIATATIVLVGIEIAQVFLPIPHEFPDLTDVILGVIGAAIGSAAGAALMQRNVGSDSARTEQRTAEIASAQHGVRHTARADGRCSMSS
jgi:glycopeptide antibiotics resistance protein